jgi:hypothetical protein
MEIRIDVPVDDVDLRGGETQVILLLSMAVPGVTALFPNLQKREVADSNPLPDIVMVVPPLMGPMEGSTDASVGAS